VVSFAIDTVKRIISE